MPLETVVLDVGGRQLAHKGCRLTASAEEAVRSASFTVAWTGTGIPCRPDEPATVTISGALWGTGFVRDVRCSHDRERHYEVTFVSRTCDATECSIDHPTGLKQDADLADVAKEFDVLGVGVEVAAQTVRKAVHKVSPGETLFDTLEPEARAQGVLIHDTPQGRLRLADGPEGRHAGVLRRGVNIKEASSALSGRHSVDKVKVKGQASDGTSGTALRQMATAAGAATRPRPLVVALEGEASSEAMKKRAAWEARRAAGAGQTATVIVAGFRDEAGRIWERNYLVEVDDDWIGINQDMVIAAASLEQDARGGTTATLSLKDPRALGGEKPRGKSDKAWEAPTPEGTAAVAVEEVSGIVGIDY